VPVPCGNDSVYCPLGSAVPLVAGPGFYTLGTVGSRYDRAVCPLGRWCVEGVARDCPSGSYGGSQGLSNSSCSGRCDDGVQCDPGSTTARGVPCPAGMYCIQGLPYACPPGTYNQREGAKSVDECLPCPSSTYNPSPGASALSSCLRCDPFEDSLPGALQCWPGILGMCVCCWVALIPSGLPVSHFAWSFSFVLRYCTVICAAVVAADLEPIFPGLSPDDTLTVYFTKVTRPAPEWCCVGVVMHWSLVPPPLCPRVSPPTTQE
jgi:hypothetical protein